MSRSTTATTTAAQQLLLLLSLLSFQSFYFREVSIDAFSPPSITPTPTPSSSSFYQRRSGDSNNIILLQAGSGMGMGGGSTATSSKKKQKNGNNKNKKKASSSNRKSAGQKQQQQQQQQQQQSQPFDAGASLLRLEKKYDQLQQASTRAMHDSSAAEDEADDGSSRDSTTTATTTTTIASEMVVTVRAVPSKTAATADWIPVAQLLLYPHVEVSSEEARAALSKYCRELSHAASLGSNLLARVPRQDLQYAIEPVESFYKYVYDPIMKVKPTTPKNSKSKSKRNGDDDDNDDDEEQENILLASMTKAQARVILELDADHMESCSSDDEQRVHIKQKYRQQSFQYHPDRLDQDMTPEDRLLASKQYARVQKAYQTLSSGIRSSNNNNSDMGTSSSAASSWYASLGGRERTDFRPVSLLSQDQATSILEQSQVQSAVVGLDGEVIRSFVVRNQATAFSSVPKPKQQQQQQPQQPQQQQQQQQQPQQQQ